MGLRKEGDRAVQAVRDKIQKKFFTEKISMSMIETDKDKDEKAKTNLKVGEEYKDRDDKIWYRTESGTIMNKSKTGFYGVPMFCPNKSCGKIMGGKESTLNNKTWYRFGHCYGCQLEKERLIQLEGQDKLKEYYEGNKKRNIESYLSDMEDLLIDCVMGDEDVKKVISSSEGEMQTWRGMGITDDEIEKFQKFVDKMKKSLGKDIETKNDKKDK